MAKVAGDLRRADKKKHPLGEEVQRVLLKSVSLGRRKG